MSQNNVDYSQNPTGPELMDNYLSKTQENSRTCNSGISRPSYAVKGTVWLDTSATPNLLKQYDGTSDIILGSLDLTNHVFLSSDSLLANGGTANYVLTGNGANTRPSYQKNPIGVFEYLTTKTYNSDDFVIGIVSGDAGLYKSLQSNNLNHALTDTLWWEAVPLGGDSLPDQTGHSGDILSTDGTDASWVDTDTIYPVVETYVNGTEWYRVYSDGWVEQGGESTNFSGTDSYVTVNLLKPFANTSYGVSAITDQSYHCSIGVTDYATGSFKIRREANSGIGTAPARWRAWGYGA